MRVLCDAIHASLYDSLRLLFEGRLGMELYRPIGMDWSTSGIWRFDHEQPWAEAVAHQFLDPWDSDVPYPMDGFSSRADTTYPGNSYRLVTLEQARSQRWDIVLSTLAPNDPGLHSLAQQTGATFGIQVGNQDAPVAWALAEFALLSVTTPGFTPWVPHVYYRQEFSLEQFAPDYGSGGLESREVQTRVQCAAQDQSYGLFKEMARRTPDLEWRWYGHCGEPDEHHGGDAPTTEQVAEQMHAARIAWHWKRWSDGYGHVIHNWAAIGRPMFVNMDYYADKLAGPLFVEGRTAWNLDRMNPGELEAAIRRLADDDDFYQETCERVSDRFNEVVDFDAEAEAIRELLSRVL